MNRARYPTITDVAKRAGVSKSLVSLVLQNSANVSRERRAAVLQAAEELGYRPNAAARSLARQRSGIIGCVVSDIHNPYFADLADGIEEGAVANGHRVLLSTGFLEPLREELALETLLQLRVDGLIMLGVGTDSAAITTAAAQIPTVMVSSPTEVPSLDSVRGDDYAGARLIVDHLVNLGHERITHISAAGASGGRRRTGYVDAMTESGHSSLIDVVGGDFTERGGADAMRVILNRAERPTAVFAPNDFAAIGALETADEAGLRVPADISLVGYDNIPFSGLHRIDLTTVAQPAARLGATAVAMVLERMSGDHTEPRRIVLAPELVVRSSSGAPPG